MINTSSSKVLPRRRKRGVAPPEDICEYIHLLNIYTERRMKQIHVCIYTSNSDLLPKIRKAGTVDWLSSTVARADAFFELVDTTFV